GESKPTGVGFDHHPKGGEDGPSAGWGVFMPTGRWSLLVLPFVLIQRLKVVFVPWDHDVRASVSAGDGVKVAHVDLAAIDMFRGDVLELFQALRAFFCIAVSTFKFDLDGVIAISVDV